MLYNRSSPRLDALLLVDGLFHLIADCKFEHLTCMGPRDMGQSSIHVTTDQRLIHSAWEGIRGKHDFSATASRRWLRQLLTFPLFPKRGQERRQTGTRSFGTCMHLCSATVIYQLLSFHCPSLSALSYPSSTAGSNRGRPIKATSFHTMMQNGLQPRATPTERVEVLASHVTRPCVMCFHICGDGGLASDTRDVTSSILFRICVGCYGFPFSCWTRYVAEHVCRLRAAVR